MRRTGPRFTVGRMMIAVALAALILGAAGEYRRLSLASARFRALADEHADAEQILRGMRPDAPIDVSPGPGLPSVRFTASAVADHEASLRHKYERAARFPWRSVARDPLPPGP